MTKRVIPRHNPEVTTIIYSSRSTSFPIAFDVISRSSWSFPGYSHFAIMFVHPGDIHIAIPFRNEERDMLRARDKRLRPGVVIDPMRARWSRARRSETEKAWSGVAIRNRRREAMPGPRKREMTDSRAMSKAGKVNPATTVHGEFTWPPDLRPRQRPKRREIGDNNFAITKTAAKIVPIGPVVALQSGDRRRPSRLDQRWHREQEEDQVAFFDWVFSSISLRYICNFPKCGSPMRQSLFVSPYWLFWDAL